MIIGVDVDGVIADLHSAWLCKYNEDFEDSLTAKDITDWDISKFVKPEAKTAIFGYLKDPFLYDDVDVIKGSLQAIEYLAAMGHTIVYVSNCNVPMVGAKVEWLERHGFLEHGVFIPIASKGTQAMHGFKKLIACDVLIDDYQENLRNFPGASVLFTNPHTPWNHEWRTFFALQASDWSEVLRVIQSL